jgi:uncharacterized membrane protein
MIVLFDGVFSTIDPPDGNVDNSANSINNSGNIAHLGSSTCRS